MTFSPAQRYSSELIGVSVGCILFGFYVSSATRCSLIIWNRFKSKQRVHPYFLLTHGLLTLLVTTRIIGALAFVIIPAVKHTYTLPPLWDPMSIFLSTTWLITLLLSDAFVCYRAYIVWSKNIYTQIIPIFLLIASCGIFFVRNNVQADTEFAATDTKCYFGKITRRTALYAGALLAASIFNNGLIAYRIWTVRQRAASLGFMSSSRLETFGKILIESAALYTVVLLIDVILVMSNDILFLIFQEIQTPLIGIIFTNMIVSSSEGNAFGCTNDADPRNDSSLPYPRSHPDSYILTDINLQTIPTTRSDHIELPISDGDEAFAIRQVDREDIDKSPSPPPLARDSRLHLGASV